MVLGSGIGVHTYQGMNENQITFKNKVIWLNYCCWVAVTPHQQKLPYKFLKNHLRYPFIFSNFFCLLCVKDFNLHSFINSDNFTNGGTRFDNKNSNCTFRRLSEGGYMHMAPGSGTSIIF